MIILSKGLVLTHKGTNNNMWVVCVVTKCCPIIHQGLHVAIKFVFSLHALAFPPLFVCDQVVRTICISSRISRNGEPPPAALAKSDPSPCPQLDRAPTIRVFE